MKKILRIIGAILTIVKLSVAYEMDSNDPYLSGNILGSVQNISISKLLDYKKIAAAIDDEFDRARFHYIIAFEIEQRKNILDKKFNLREKKYIKAIKSYEKELDLTLHKFANDKPRFDHIYQKADITEEAIENDVHRIQAALAKTQFIQVYKYYRRKLDNYKSHLITLRELYKCKIIDNQDSQVEYYSNFPEMYRGIKLFDKSINNAGQMKIQRDPLGKVLFIDWKVKDENDKKHRREFKYSEDGKLSKLSDRVNGKLSFETDFNKNQIAEDFLDYLFSPGFIPRDYNYFTEIYYNENKVSAYKFSSNNGHVIGTIYREYDQKDHLVKETWCKGETSKILREFSSIFDPKSGEYKLIERDKNGRIINQEIVLSNND